MLITPVFWVFSSLKGWAAQGALGRAPVPAVACGVVEQEGQHCSGDAPEIRGSGPDSGPCDSPEHPYSHGGCGKLLCLTLSPALNSRSVGCSPSLPPAQTGECHTQVGLTHCWVTLTQYKAEQLYFRKCFRFHFIFLFPSFAVLLRDVFLWFSVPHASQQTQGVLTQTEHEIQVKETVCRTNLMIFGLLMG